MTENKKKKQGDKGHITSTDIVKFIKSLRLRWYGHAERIQNQRMPKQITTATMERRRERGNHVKDRQKRFKMN